MGDILVKVGRFFSFLLYHNDKVEVRVSTVIIIIAIFVTAHYLLKFLKKVFTRRLSGPDKDKFHSVFTFVRYFIFALLFLYVCGMIGVDVKFFLTASAALFVGLGFALQQLFQDLIAGIYMILDKSLHVGDVIEVDNKLCTVLSIHLRSTRAITRDERMLIIPNHRFITDTIYNWTQDGKVVRTHIEVPVYIGTDLDLARKVLHDSAASIGEVLHYPKPIVMLNRFDASSVVLFLHVFLDNSFDNDRILSEVRFEVYRRFQENHIQFPVPVINLLEKNKLGQFKTSD